MRKTSDMALHFVAPRVDAPAGQPSLKSLLCMQVHCPSKLAVHAVRRSSLPLEVLTVPHLAALGQIRCVRAQNPPSKTQDSKKNSYNIHHIITSPRASMCCPRLCLPPAYIVCCLAQQWRARLLLVFLGGRSFSLATNTTTSATTTTATTTTLGFGVATKGSNLRPRGPRWDSRSESFGRLLP